MTKVPVMPHALLDTVAAQAAEFVALRRDIHRHPELGFEEFRTSDLVAERLARCTTPWNAAWAALASWAVAGAAAAPSGWACERTWMRFHRRGHGPAPRELPPRRDASGHDGHTAMLLAAAHHLPVQGDFRLPRST